MSCQIRQRSVTGHVAARSYCGHWNPEDPAADLIEAIEDAIAGADALGTLDSDARRDAALTVCLGVIYRLVDDEDITEASRRVVEALALTAA